MPAVITCPECEKRFKGKPGLEGKRIRCPSCGHGFIVPDEEDEELAERLSRNRKGPAKAAPAGPKMGGGIKGDERKYGVTELDLAPRCPNCTKEMDEGAIICLFCGYNTQTRALGVTTKTVEKTGGDHFLHILPGLACATVILMLIIWMLFFSLELSRPMDREGWLYAVCSHESVKFWNTMIWLALVWGLGRFCYKRLILEPTPAEDIKE
jgi:hypothetical protein